MKGERGKGEAAEPGPRPLARAVVSWSGGKDSCLAAQLALERGIVIEALLCMFEPDADRSRSHALPQWILSAQAAAAGCALISPRADWATYEDVFVETLRSQARAGIERVIFGDIDLQAHRDWEERVTAAAGLTADLPLWHWPTSRVVDEARARGIEAVCVCVNTRYLPAEFCGRPWNADFLRDLPSGVDPCGENGEFHTVVTHAPLFGAPIDVRVAGRDPYEAPRELGGDLYWFARLEPGAA